MRIPSPTARRPRRGAVQAAELLMVLPLLLVLVLGMVEYSLMLSVDQQLAVASREGARVAAQGGSHEEAAAAAALVLGNGAVAQHATVTTNLVDADGSPTPVPPGQPVDVRVAIADATAVVPDLLRFIGLSMKNKRLSGHTILRKE